MTLEDQIAALLAEAEPLRCLPDEEAESKGLPALVDRINALRMIQESANRDDPYKPAAGISQIVGATSQRDVGGNPRRGLLPKAKQEGADA